MSLRNRLTILYTFLLGGILLVFSVVVYGAVKYSITNQIDNLLRRTSIDIFRASRVDTFGKSSLIIIPTTNLPTDVFVQVWENDGTLGTTSPNIALYDQPLDQAGLQAEKPTFHEVYIGETHLRVLSVALVIEGSDRKVGTLQVATNLTLVDTTQKVLVWVLFLGVLLAILVAAVAGWLSTRQALTPLQSVTQTALHITRADDLSRRIPYQGSPEDEVGQLIQAFNQTLGRLENLFNTQRRFMSDVGHELRTPLTVIRGYVDLMRRTGEMDDESLCSIEGEVDRLTRMVGDLLLLAQAESGKIPLDRRTVELDTLVLEVLSQMRVLARDKLQLKLGDIDQVLVCGDRDRLKQVLVNLVGNAINYTPAGGEIVVGLGKAGNQARLTVSDTGSGIPTNDLPHVFERFYRGEKSRTRSRDGKGFGLGLSIAYWIVRNHQGRIEVNSTTDPTNHGTTFCVWLPLAEDGCQTES